MTETLRTAWQFPAVSEFIYLFWSPIGLESTIETNDLENMFGSLDYDPPVQLAQVYVSVIKTIMSPPRSYMVNIESWWKFCVDLFSVRVTEDNLIDGIGSEPFQTPLNPDINFMDHTPLQRLMILYVLIEWLFMQPDHLREKVSDEVDQADWRIDPIGYDSKGNTYYLFDDYRLYRSIPPAPVYKPKGKPYKPKSKRGRKRTTGTQTPTTTASSVSSFSSSLASAIDDSNEPAWELVCHSIETWDAFLQSLSESRRSDDKDFYDSLKEDVYPHVEKEFKETERLKLLELANETRKRSSRLQSKESERAEKERQEREYYEAQKSKKDEEKRKRLAEKEERERHERLYAREQRQLEREEKIHRKEEDANLLRYRTDLKNRLIELERIERNKRRLGEINTVDFKFSVPYIPVRMTADDPELTTDSWFFSCECGVHGLNFDDTTPLVACEVCSIWQHIGCNINNGRKSKKSNISKNGIPDHWEGEFICTECRNLGLASKYKDVLRIYESNRIKPVKTNEDDLIVDIESNDISPTPTLINQPTKSVNTKKPKPLPVPVSTPTVPVAASVKEPKPAPKNTVPSIIPKPKPTPTSNVSTQKLASTAVKTTVLPGPQVPADLSKSQATNLNQNEVNYTPAAQNIPVNQAYYQQNAGISHQYGVPHQPINMTGNQNYPRPSMNYIPNQQLPINYHNNSNQGYYGYNVPISPNQPVYYQTQPQQVHQQWLPGNQHTNVAFNHMPAHLQTQQKVQPINPLNIESKNVNIDDIGVGQKRSLNSPIDFHNNKLLKSPANTSVSHSEDINLKKTNSDDKSKI